MYTRSWIIDLNEYVSVCVWVGGVRRTEAESCDTTQPAGLKEVGMGVGQDRGHGRWLLEPRATR